MSNPVPQGEMPNPWWQQPNAEVNAWNPPGHDRAFRDSRVPVEDPVKRGFVARKRHGWWGKTVYYDPNGNEIG